MAKGKRNALNVAPRIKDVEFILCDYNKIPTPSSSIIYCDPPYRYVGKYRETPNFDSDSFWHWVREKSQQGHDVFISEYEAPSDFKCVWKKSVNMSATSPKKGRSNKRIEKLFRQSTN